MVTSLMSERSCSETPFGSHPVNGFQRLLKSARHPFCPTVLLIRDQLSWKKFPLVRLEILGLFINILTSAGKYSHHNRENFLQQIQMQLSQKPKNFYQLFFAFLKCTLNSEYFEKKDQTHSLRIFKIINCEIVTV